MIIYVLAREDECKARQVYCVEMVRYVNMITDFVDLRITYQR